ALRRGTGRCLDHDRGSALSRRLQRLCVLPALRVRRPLLPSRRTLVPVASILLALGGFSAYWPAAAPDSASVADELRPATWAMTVPSAWLAAPVPPVRRDDAIDILAMRAGDKGYSIPAAYGV